MTSDLQELSEKLWNSHKISGLIKFYEINNSIAKLMSFSRGRPRANVKIDVSRENADSTIVVVVPTISAQSENALSIIRLFAPLPVIFVESRGQFFNYAHSINSGVDQALKLGAEWIILSNDDMVMIDSTKKLIQEIMQNSDYDYLLALPEYDSAFTHSCLVELNRTESISELLTRLPWAFYNINLPMTMFETMLRRRYSIHIKPNIYPEGLGSVSNQVGYIRWLYYTLVRTIYPKSKSVGLSFRNFANFGVFKRDVLTHQTMDDTFINGYEDADLTLRLVSNGYTNKMINYRIGHMSGDSLSSNRQDSLVREFKEIFNEAYFSNKVESMLNNGLR